MSSRRELPDLTELADAHKDFVRRITPIVRKLEALLPEARELYKRTEGALVLTRDAVEDRDHSILCAAEERLWLELHEMTGHSDTVLHLRDLADEIADGNPDDVLMSASDVADRLGVTRQRVDQIAKEDPTFPKPTIVGKRNRAWRMNELEKWATETSRQRARDYIAYVLDQIPEGSEGDAVGVYRAALREGIAAALRGSGGRPPTVAGAHEWALTLARAIDESFDWREPSSPDEWARSKGLRLRDKAL